MVISNISDLMTFTVSVSEGSNIAAPAEKIHRLLSDRSRLFCSRSGSLRCPKGPNPQKIFHEFGDHQLSHPKVQKIFPCAKSRRNFKGSQIVTGSSLSFNTHDHINPITYCLMNIKSMGLLDRMKSIT